MQSGQFHIFKNNVIVVNLMAIKLTANFENTKMIINLGTSKNPKIKACDRGITSPCPLQRGKKS